MNSLTRGSINAIISSQAAPADLKPIVQVLNIKAISSTTATAAQRYRFVLYDGVDQVTAMLATQLNHIVLNNEVNENYLVRLEEYTKSIISNSAVVIILKMQVVGVAPDIRTVAPQNNSHNPTSQYQGAGAPNQAVGGVGGGNNPVGQGAFNNNNNNNNSNHNNNNSINNNSSMFNKPQNAMPAPNYGTNSTLNAPSYNSNTNVKSQYPQQVHTAPSMHNQQPQQSQQQFHSAPTPNPYGGAMMGAGQHNYKPVSRSNDIGSGPTDVTPVKALSPYSNKWTVRVRVTGKSDIKTWSNAKGEGKLFSVDLLDAENTAIRAVFWKDACDKFFPLLEEGKVYLFSGGKVKQVDPKSRKFSTIQNEYELELGVQADIKPVVDDGRIKNQTFNFVKIRSLMDLPVDNIVDVIGIVRSATEVQEINSKTQGKPLQKRDIVIVDQSQADIKVTLWGDKALFNHNWNELPIVAFRGVKIGDYGGRNLGTITSTVVQVNPDLPEAFALYEWKNQFPDQVIPMWDMLTSTGGGGDRGSDMSLERRKPIASIRDEGLGTGSDKGDYVTICGYIQFIKKDGQSPPWYNACPACNKKILEVMMRWHCESCNKQFDQPVHRYILSFQMQDFSGNSWFSIFDEAGQKIFGVTADHLEELKSAGNEMEVDRIFDVPLFRMYTVRAKVKQEAYQSEQKIKQQVMQIQPVDFVQQNRSLLDAINKYY